MKVLRPNDRISPTRVRHGVLGALCLAALLAYISRNAISVAEEDIRGELELSEHQMGWAMAAFYVSYAVFQLPGGWSGDRWGGRTVLPIFAVLWAVATAVLGFSSGLVFIIVAQILMGAAQAGLFPSSVLTISHWIPERRRAFSCGSLASSMSIGGALATSMTGVLLGAGVHWRSVFWLFAIPAIFWAIGFRYWFRDHPSEHRSVNEAELSVISDSEDGNRVSGETPEKGVPWSRLLAKRDLWLICGQQFFRAAGYIFYATWFPTFLKETRGVDTAESGLLASLPLLAVVVGSLSGGALVDHLWKATRSRRWSRQVVATASLAACSICVFFAYLANDTASLMLAITIGSFFAALAGPCGYSITIDKGGSHVATVFGMMNMAGNLGAAACPPVVAWIAGSASWNVVLVFFAAVYAGAAVCWGLINPEGQLVGGVGGGD